MVVRWVFWEWGPSNAWVIDGDPAHECVAVMGTVVHGCTPIWETGVHGMHACSTHNRAHMRGCGSDSSA
jgi:hypothetical protein